MIRKWGMWAKILVLFLPPSWNSRRRLGWAWTQRSASRVCHHLWLHLLKQVVFMISLPHLMSAGLASMQHHAQPNMFSEAILWYPGLWQPLESLVTDGRNTFIFIKNSQAWPHRVWAHLPSSYSDNSQVWYILTVNVTGFTSEMHTSLSVSLRVFPEDSRIPWGIPDRIKQEKR